MQEFCLTWVKSVRGCTSTESSRYISVSLPILALSRIRVREEDDFVFSLAKVKAYTDSFHRLSQAKRADQVYKKKHNLIEIPRAAGKAA